MNVLDPVADLQEPVEDLQEPVADLQEAASDPLAPVEGSPLGAGL
ncbi:hypothetical protein [Polyangium mundeleinium]|uniref:Uncharacterized protein n=1 Tax=Polyangium mundeleinium TaxID=2995306 RepID=A0ABT5F2T1_9BACT|nr:hypothetical protein [Polyangium mundeleinium]MDC0748306.1 hypothetical protein [Polyangium mundeleinium]